jgi:hypothetical protein
MHIVSGQLNGVCAKRRLGTIGIALVAIPTAVRANSSSMPHANVYSDRDAIKRHVVVSTAHIRPIP